MDPLVKISLRRRHALMVENGALGHKIDYVTIFRASKSLYWVKTYANFDERGDFT